MGRPRNFDLDEALDQAVLVFWRLGYERTTVTDLCEAMEINRPSLYAAFGTKEQLFHRALDRYATGPHAYESEALALSRPRARSPRRSSAAPSTGRRASTPRTAASPCSARRPIPTRTRRSPAR